MAKCLCFYISLRSKLDYGWGRGVQNLQNPVYVVYEQPPRENNFVNISFSFYFYQETQSVKFISVISRFGSMLIIFQRFFFCSFKTSHNTESSHLFKVYIESMYIRISVRKRSGPIKIIPVGHVILCFE